MGGTIHFHRGRIADGVNRDACPEELGRPEEKQRRGDQQSPNATARAIGLEEAFGAEKGASYFAVQK